MVLPYNGRKRWFMLPNSDKTRVSVTMTQTYVEALDTLVDKGIYLARGEAVLHALRDLFGEHKIEPFCKKNQNPVE